MFEKFKRWMSGRSNPDPLGPGNGNSGERRSEQTTPRTPRTPVQPSWRRGTHDPQNGKVTGGDVLPTNTPVSTQPAADTDDSGKNAGISLPLVPGQMTENSPPAEIRYGSFWQEPEPTQDTTSTNEPVEVPPVTRPAPAPGPKPDAPAEPELPKTPQVQAVEPPEPQTATPVTPPAESPGPRSIPQGLRPQRVAAAPLSRQAATPQRPPTPPVGPPPPEPPELADDGFPKDFGPLFKMLWECLTRTGKGSTAGLHGLLRLPFYISARLCKAWKAIAEKRRQEIAEKTKKDREHAWKWVEENPAYFFYSVLTIGIVGLVSYWWSGKISNDTMLIIAGIGVAILIVWGGLLPSMVKYIIYAGEKLQKYVFQPAGGFAKKLLSGEYGEGVAAFIWSTAIAVVCIWWAATHYGDGDPKVIWVGFLGFSSGIVAFIILIHGTTTKIQGLKEK